MSHKAIHNLILLQYSCSIFARESLALKYSYVVFYSPDRNTTTIECQYSTIDSHNEDDRK